MKREEKEKRFRIIDALSRDRVPVFNELVRDLKKWERQEKLKKLGWVK